jgi:hypothetical protein
MPIEKLFLLKNIVLIFIDDFAYNMMGATSGAGTAYPYGAPELFFFYCFVDHYLSFVLFLLVIVLSVL